jgi:hypothetical protein
VIGRDFCKEEEVSKSQRTIRKQFKQEKLKPHRKKVTKRQKLIKELDESRSARS